MHTSSLLFAKCDLIVGTPNAGAAAAAAAAAAGQASSAAAAASAAGKNLYFLLKCSCET